MKQYEMLPVSFQIDDNFFTDIFIVHNIQEN